MPDRDPTQDRLEEFARDGAGPRSGVPMPFTASAARTRGEALRRRRRGLLAGGAALTAAAVTVPLVLLTGGGDERGLVTDQPSPSPSAVPDVRTSALLTDDDTVFNQGSDWVRAWEYRGDGQSPFHPCARATLTSLGATSVVVGEYELRSGSQPDAAGGALLQQAIARFPSEDAAETARATVAGWIDDCSEAVASLGATQYRVTQTRPLDPAVEGASIIDAQYGPVDRELDPYGDAAYIAETGLGVVGDTLVVLGSQVVGQDYNFLPEDGGTPVNRMLAVALERARDDR